MTITLPRISELSTRKKFGSMSRTLSSPCLIDYNPSPVHDTYKKDELAFKSYPTKEEYSPRPLSSTYCNKVELTPVICNSRVDMSTPDVKLNSSHVDGFSNQLNICEALNESSSICILPRSAAVASIITPINLSSHGTCNINNITPGSDSHEHMMPSLTNVEYSQQSRNEDTAQLNGDVESNDASCYDETSMDISSHGCLSKMSLDRSSHSYAGIGDARYQDLLDMAIEEEGNNCYTSEIKQYQPSRDSTLVPCTKMKQEDLDGIFMNSSFVTGEEIMDHASNSNSTQAQSSSIPSISHACALKSMDSSVSSLNTDYQNIFTRVKDDDFIDHDEGSLSSYDEDAHLNHKTCFDIDVVKADLQGNRVDERFQFLDEAHDAPSNAAVMHHQGNVNCNIRGDKRKRLNKLTIEEECKAYEWLKTVEIDKNNDFFAEAASSKFLTGKVDRTSRNHSSLLFHRKKANIKTINPSAIFLPKEIPHRF